MSRGRDKAEEFLPRTGKTAGTDLFIEKQSFENIPDTLASDRVQIQLPVDETGNFTDSVDISVAPDSITVNQRATISTLHDSTAIISDDPAIVSGSIPGPGSEPDGAIDHVVTDSIKRSVWDQIDLRVKQIESVRNESLAKEARADKSTGSQPVKETYNYDASYVMSDEPEFFSLLSIFPSFLNISGEPVFEETGPSTFNNASLAYQVYLQRDTFTAGLSEAEEGAAQYSTAWMPALVILSFLLLAWIKLIYVQFLTPVLISAFNYKESVKLFHGKNAPAQNAFLILQIIFAINSGLFLLFVSGFFNLKTPDIKPSILFLISSASVLFLYTFKFAALSFLGFLFEKKKLFSEYRYNISLYNKIYGLLLLPMVIGLLYGGETLYTTIIYTGLFMGIIFYFLQLIRGLEIIVRKDFSVFYLILYLCAFEIFPILVLYKLVDVFLL